VTIEFEGIVHACASPIRGPATAWTQWLFAPVSNSYICTQAILYSLIWTARLNGMDCDTCFSRIGEHPIKHVEELRPWKVAGKLGPTLQQAAQTSQRHFRYRGG